MKRLRRLFNFARKRASVPPTIRSANFLKALPTLTFDERQQLRSLGAESPEALYAAINASPDPFERLLGPVKLHRLLKELFQLIPAENRTVLENFEFVAPPLGVMIGHEPPQSLCRA